MRVAFLAAAMLGLVVPSGGAGVRACAGRRRGVSLFRVSFTNTTSRRPSRSTSAIYADSLLVDLTYGLTDKTAINISLPGGDALTERRRTRCRTFRAQPCR
jgi:hypothetical protein